MQKRVMMNERLWARTRWVVCAIGLYGLLCAGCASVPPPPAPAAPDAEWVSNIQTGRNGWQQADFERAAAAFARAVKRARALDNPEAAAVAAIDRARCVQELEYADALARLNDPLLAEKGPRPMEGYRASVVADLRAALQDSRLPLARRDELTVTLAEWLPPDEALLLLVNLTQRADSLPSALRARMALVCAQDALAQGDLKALHDALMCFPTGKKAGELPLTLRARREVLLAHSVRGVPYLVGLEKAVEWFRRAERPDAVAVTLLSAMEACTGEANCDASVPIPLDVVFDMLCRAASSCHAQGYAALAARVLDELASWKQVPDAAARVALLRAALTGLPAPAAPKAESSTEGQP